VGLLSAFFFFPSASSFLFFPQSVLCPSAPRVASFESDDDDDIEQLDNRTPRVLSEPSVSPVVAVQPLPSPLTASLSPNLDSESESESSQSIDSREADIAWLESLIAGLPESELPEAEDSSMFSSIFGQANEVSKEISLPSGSSNVAEKKAPPPAAPPATVGRFSKNVALFLLFW
jgi:hypothetical protein